MSVHPFTPPQGTKEALSAAQTATDFCNQSVSWEPLKLDKQAQQQLAQRAQADSFSGVNNSLVIQSEAHERWNNHYQPALDEGSNIIGHITETIKNLKHKAAQIKYEGSPSRNNTRASFSFEFVEVTLFLMIAIAAECATTLQIAKGVELMNLNLTTLLAICIGLLNFFGAFIISRLYFNVRREINRRKWKWFLGGIGFVALFSWLGVFGATNGDIIYDVAAGSSGFSSGEAQYTLSNNSPSSTSYTLGSSTPEPESNQFVSLSTIVWISQIIIGQFGLALALITLQELLKANGRQDIRIWREQAARKRARLKKEVITLQQLSRQVESRLQEYQEAGKNYAQEISGIYQGIQLNLSQTLKRA